MLSFLFERDLVPNNALLKGDTPAIESKAEHLTIRPHRATFQFARVFLRHRI